MLMLLAVSCSHLRVRACWVALLWVWDLCASLFWLLHLFVHPARGTCMRVPHCLAL